MRSIQNHFFKLLIFIIIICNSCGKPCGNENIVLCEAHPLYLKYFGPFKVGNHWIYETEDSSQRDSLFVEIVSKAGSKLNEETCEQYSSFSFVGMIFNSGNNLRLLNLVFQHLNSCNDGIISFYYNLNGNEKISIFITNTISSDNAEIIPEILLNNTMYTDVLHIYVDQREYFFAPQIGLIRYIISDSLNSPVIHNLKTYYIQ